ncbi:MAG: hypothetical protein JWO09_1143 [Bacteroidetes bacterium]|nr:hypothetical protein [Bacteroidota bacterium]
MIVPIKKMNERVQVARQDGDTTLFMNLMYSGEQLLKLITSAMVAGITDSKGSRDNDQYAQNYKLVHADSIGVWTQTMETLIAGPSHHYLSEEFRPFLSELTEKVSNPSWQYGALFALNNCLKILNVAQEELPVRAQLKSWFSLFVRLRNDARAHGIINADQAGTISQNLEKSIKLITENFSLFKAPWLYAKQNISGSYRITSLNEQGITTEVQKTIDSTSPEDGIFLFIKQPFRIDIIESTVEATDFYFPNGNFSDKSYECISYISGRKLFSQSSNYLKPPGQLPSSETEGMGELSLIHETFTNIPNLQSIYINRKNLEDELYNVLLMNDRYPIVTLSGRGGIGKTSLALHILHKICSETRFAAIVWLSARDIDLLEEGPKTVRPQILNENDIANEFSKLISPPNFNNKKLFSAKEFMEKELKEAGSNTNGQILFVMDNFETLRNPRQVYAWLDMHIRNPNKILITSRLRDFKADYPINVDGMNRDEFNELVERVALKLNIQQRLNKPFLDELFRESDGHPYVIKVMLGEVSQQKELKNVKRVIASKDEILTALFERTYSDLSPAAKRVFLTLCSWRNILPEVAIEAILNREENELINVEDSIMELFRYSFVELTESYTDKSTFVDVPLTAFEFGRKKLSVSPLKSKIQLDIDLLNFFGVTQYTDINKGLKPKVEQFFKNIAQSVKIKKEGIKKFIPIMNFVCRKYPYGWTMLYKIYYETNEIPKAIDCLQNFVADHKVSTAEKLPYWELLSKLYALQKDYAAEAQTLIEICNIDDLSFNDLSNAVQSLMNLFKEKKLLIRKEEIFMALNLIAERMNLRIQEGGISDLTKLAWVYIYIEKKEKAKKLVQMALKKDQYYIHALNLAKVLKMRIKLED